MIVYQQIENNVLQPLVYHRTVQVSALAIAVSVAAGAEIGGIVGALLGIPVAGALKVVSRELLAWRRGEDPPETAPHMGESRHETRRTVPGVLEPARSSDHPLSESERHEHHGDTAWDEAGRTAEEFIGNDLDPDEPRSGKTD